MKIDLLTLVAVLVAGLMVLGGNQAQASDVNCGDTLGANTTLHENLVCGAAPGLTIDTDNITLDCDGFTITGPDSGSGILLVGVSNVTVKDCHVTNFGAGFSLSSSDRNTLKDNLATDNGFTGFLLNASDGNTLKDNLATDNIGRGFVLGSGSTGNTLKDNMATDNGFRGFDLNASSDDNMLKGNVADDNDSAGFVVSGGSTGNTLKENTATDSEFEGFAIFSSGNILKKNTADDNGTFGYRDTTGPANTYPALSNKHANLCTGNTSGGSLPTGLCTPQP